MRPKVSRTIITLIMLVYSHAKMSNEAETLRIVLVT